MKTLWFILLTTVIACSSQNKKAQEKKEAEIKVTSAVSDMHSAKMKKLKGMITIEETETDIKVTTDVSGLKPNSKLGFHIHENGICEGPDYKSAGDHFNPEQLKHGKPGKGEHHRGDLGNLSTNGKGEAKQVITIPKTEIGSLDQLIGKAILIHSKADDFKTQPSGNSGNRIACGLIKPI